MPLALQEGLALLPPAMDTPAARVLLLAIGLQESGLKHRVQISPGAPGGRGPARGLLQFERSGGCAGVLRHSASRYWMHAACRARGVKPTPGELWAALELDDALAFAAGRLLLFTDPRRLPAPDDSLGAWALYLRTWRPGKPHAKTWAKNHAAAVAKVGAGHA